MQTLTPGQYNALNSTSRLPCAQVFLQQSKESIPFEGKLVNVTTTHEKYPFCIEHSTGRAVLVYSKYETASLHYSLWFKSSDINQELWNVPINLTISPAFDYLTPTAVQLNSSNNIGIIINRSGSLYSIVIDQNGAIVTGLTNLSITGVTPNLCKVGTTYWLTYEVSGILYYRTSANFTTWSSATSFNSKTGLSNSHRNPFLYYDKNSKLWLCFERVTDVVASPEVTNCYYMISINQGSTWATPVAQTTVVAGQGSCYRPSMVDVGVYRYYSYILQQQIQNYIPPMGIFTNGLIFDNVRNRIIYVTGQGVSNNTLRILDRETGLTDSYLLSDHGMTVGYTSCVDYDEINQIIVIGIAGSPSGGGGIITYNETTSTWALYNETSTPAIGCDYVLNALRIKNNKIYYWGMSRIYNYKFGILNLSSLTNTLLTTPTTWQSPGTFSLDSRVFVSANYMICTTSDNTGTYWAYPHIAVYRLSDNVLLYQTHIGYGTSYQFVNSFYGSACFRTYDEENDYFYSPAQDMTVTTDYGLIKCQVGASSINIIKYYSNAISNPYGLLPHPDVANSIYTITRQLSYSDNKLYIQAWRGTEYGSLSQPCYEVFNTLTEQVDLYYAPTDNTTYLANFPAIDALFIKILLLGSYLPNGSYYDFTSNEYGEILFYSSQENGSNPRLTLIQTSNEANRVYYKRTLDNITWDIAHYLTNLKSDDYLKLTLLSSKLTAFWARIYTGISQLFWDEDLANAMELTDNVVSFSITKNEENKSNKVTLVIEDKNRIYHPLNYNSLKNTYLKENNLIIIKKGNNGNYTPAFYGYIGAGDAEDKRGSDILYSLEVYDRSKLFYRKKITTPFFEDKTVAYIASYIAATYMLLIPEEYSTLPNITDVIHQVQFIEEYPMDILQKIYQPFNYFATFNEEGNLIAKEYNYEATVNYTYYQDGTDTVGISKAPAMNIISFGFNWNDDDLVNQVTVIGETEETHETVHEEEFMGTIQGASGWFSKSNTFTFYFSEDQTLECVEPRLNVKDSCGNRFFGGGESLSFVPGSGEQGENIYCTIHQNISNLITGLYVLIAAALICQILWGFGIGGGWGAVYVHVMTWNPLALVVAVALTILGQVGSYYYEIYAKPVGEPLPTTIPAVADDFELQTIYGQVINKEIDNPFLHTYEKCYALANNELQKLKWFRYVPNIKILSNMSHQIGDVIQVFNPNTGLSYKIYITEITQNYSRGNEDTDTIKGGLIT